MGYATVRLSGSPIARDLEKYTEASLFVSVRLSGSPIARDLYFNVIFSASTSNRHVFDVFFQTILHNKKAIRHSSNFSQISDAALDNLVRQILTLAPQSGIGLIRGALQSRGWRTSDYGSFAKIRPSRVCPETNKANNLQNIQCPQSQFTHCSTYQF